MKFLSLFIASFVLVHLMLFGTYETRKYEAALFLSFLLFCFHALDMFKLAYSAWFANSTFYKETLKEKSKNESHN